jgi:hypothetical protein
MHKAEPTPTLAERSVGGLGKKRFSSRASPLDGETKFSSGKRLLESFPGNGQVVDPANRKTSRSDQ